MPYTITSPEVHALYKEHIKTKLFEDTPLQTRNANFNGIPVSVATLSDVGMLLHRWHEIYVYMAFKNQTWLHLEDASVAVKDYLNHINLVNFMEFGLNAFPNVSRLITSFQILRLCHHDDDQIEPQEVIDHSEEYLKLLHIRLLASQTPYDLLHHPILIEIYDDTNTQRRELYHISI